MEAQKKLAVMQRFGHIYRIFASAFDSHVGLPLSRWHILLALHAEEAPLSQKQLAERLRIDPASLTRQLKHLDALCWIERTISKQDNRVVNIKLSSAGAAVFAEYLPRRDAFLLETIDPIPDAAVAALANALSQIEAGVAPLPERARN